MFDIEEVEFEPFGHTTLERFDDSSKKKEPVKDEPEPEPVLKPKPPVKDPI